MEYTGEHLLPGQLGHFFIVLSLVSSLVASFAYFRSSQTAGLSEITDHWKKLARYAFIIESISVFSIFAILFYIIQQHLFEYKYAWQHSSRSLEFKYLLACFWEGQEGSFLLWSIWHCVLGLILIRTAKKWEAPVMTVVSFAQFALATMITGIYFLGWKMGSNPFQLLRDSGVLDNAAALHINMDPSQGLIPDYLASIKDGNDLNPLLQNYWMVIHPPVLFLGFATTIIPFSYAVAGIWKNGGGEWTKLTMPWALFSAAALGVGIMMGGMWAYESLTFGGYWAWDPVENASLVPWLVLIAGIHTALIYKSTGYSLRSTYVFYFLSFILVLYSTFLTRSGILGETSVHAFTDLGMNAQLYLFLYIFIWLPALLAAPTLKEKWMVIGLSVLLVLATYFLKINSLALISCLLGLVWAAYFVSKQVPAVKKEEETSSREFWMFIGALVFFLSAIEIIVKTSLPVINKLFGSSIAPPEDAEFSYNSIQVYVAIITGLLTAFTQYLKYRSTTRSYFWKKMAIPFILSVIIATLILVFGNVNYTRKGPGFQIAIWIAVACAAYAIIANAAYIWLGMKGKLRIAGGSIAHVGFGMVLLGILITSAKKEILSNNLNGIPAPLGPKEDPRENLTLVKDLKVDMGKYSLTYLGDSMHPRKQLWFYKVRFQSKDGKEDFLLMPNAFVNYKGNEGLMANPSAKHYWDHDVFTYITSLPNPDNKDTASFRPSTIKMGDTIFYSKGYIVTDSLQTRGDLPESLFGKDGRLYELPMKIFARTGSIYSVRSKLAFAKGDFVPIADTVTAESLVIQLQKVNPDKTIELGVKESNALMKYVTLKAFKYPFINLLWAGVLVTALGLLISMASRIRRRREM
ncbi:MAG: cytochrome c biogenesis protein CcsA [Chitinophagaceae bacterium]|nr:cytochrome c biogenesis protein CcsA [Chitinophagaceae bacterium]